MYRIFLKTFLALDVHTVKVGCSKASLLFFFPFVFVQGKQRELQHEQPQRTHVVHERKQDDDGQLGRRQNPYRNSRSHVVEPSAAAHFRLRPPASTRLGCSAGAQRSTSAKRRDCTKRGLNAPPTPPPPRPA